MVTDALPLKEPEDFRRFSDASIGAKEDMLRSAMLDAVPSFNEYKGRVARQKRSPAKELFMRLDPAQIPLAFLIHVGRFLGFPEMPSSESWRHAGASYNFRMFCKKLWEQMQGVAPRANSPLLSDDDFDNLSELGNNNAPSVVTAQPVVISESQSFKSGSRNSNFLRLCLLKVATDHLKEGKPYSETNLLGDWLEEAIESYQLHCTDMQCNPIPVSELPDIRATAGGTWVSRISAKSKVPGMLEPTPASDSVFKDWALSKPFFRQWEGYYCGYIRHHRCKLLKTGQKKRSLNPSLNTSQRNQKRKRIADTAEPTDALASDGEDDEDRRESAETFNAEEVQILKNFKADSLEVKDSLKRTEAMMERNTIATEKLHDALNLLVGEMRAQRHSHHPSPPMMMLTSRGPSPSNGMYTPDHSNNNDLVVSRFTS